MTYNAINSLKYGFDNINGLDTWDVEYLCVFNPDIIIPIEENAFERAGEDLGYINIYCDGGEAAFRNACIGAGSNDPLTYAGLGVLSPTYDEEFAVTIHQNS